MTKKTYDPFDDVPIVPRTVTYAPTRDGRKRWAVRVIQLDDNARVAGDDVPMWHVWDRELAAHFSDRKDTVVHVGGYVTARGPVTYVTITSTRFDEVAMTWAEWEELSDVQALERAFAAPTSEEAADA